MQLHEPKRWLVWGLTKNNRRQCCIIIRMDNRKISISRTNWWQYLSYCIKKLKMVPIRLIKQNNIKLNVRDYNLTGFPKRYPVLVLNNTKLKNLFLSKLSFILDGFWPLLNFQDWPEFWPLLDVHVVESFRWFRY